MPPEADAEPEPAGATGAGLLQRLTGGHVFNMLRPMAWCGQRYIWKDVYSVVGYISLQGWIRLVVILFVVCLVALGLFGIMQQAAYCP